MTRAFSATTIGAPLYINNGLAIERPFDSLADNWRTGIDLRARETEIWQCFVLDSQ
jgi:hypothetical protein